MGSLDEALPPGADWIGRKFAEIDRRLREMAAARSIAATLGSGAVAGLDGLSEKPAISDAVLWVSTTGNNSDDGLSPGSAKATIQAACDALPSTGGKVYLLAGIHTGGVVTDKPNLEIEGVGGIGQDNTLAEARTQITAGNGQIAFTWEAAATAFRGPVFRNVRFQAVHASATGGLYLNQANNFLLDNCGASDFTNGYGIHVERSTTPGADAAQYGTLINPVISGCQIGLDNEGNALRIFGGLFEGNYNSGTPSSGTTGIKQRTGAALKVFGTVVQGWAIGLDLDGIMHEVSHMYGEYNTLHIKIAGDFNNVVGGNFSNAIMGGTGTAIQVLATADRSHIISPQISSVTTAVDDAGTNTRWDHVNEIHLGDDNGASPAKVFFGTDVSLYRASTDKLKTDDDVEIVGNLFLGSVIRLAERSDPSAPPANQAYIYARDNGSGKTQIVALFPTGAVQQIAIEP